MKTSQLALATLTLLTAAACTTPERVVYVERERTVTRSTPSPTPYRKAPVSSPQDNPYTFDAVTKPQSYSGY